MWIRSLNASWVRGGVCSVSWLNIVLLFHFILCSPVFTCVLLVNQPCVSSLCAPVSSRLSWFCFLAFVPRVFPGLIVTFWFGGCVSWFVRCLAFIFHLCICLFHQIRPVPACLPRVLRLGLHYLPHITHRCLGESIHRPLKGFVQLTWWLLSKKTKSGLTSGWNNTTSCDGHIV